MKLSEVPTPALCVDVETLTRNVEAMAAFFRDRPCALRPHFKAHKTPAIATLQATAGCRGFTCATVGEAEVLARHGFTDLLIANEVCDPAKIDRLRRLAEQVDLTIAVDSVAAVEIVDGCTAGALVDVNVGLPRCGVDPEGAGAVARAVDGSSLRLRGVMGYEGHAMIVEDTGERAGVSSASMNVLLEVADALRNDGFDIPIVSAGGTGTYDTTGTTPGVTELQAGSYALMDTEYAKLGLPFGEALRCVTTLLSAQGTIAVLDAGLKTLAVDHGNPLLADGVGAEVLFLSDEHTTLVTSDAFLARVGDRLWLRPSHVDPTVNLHDRLYAISGEDIVDEWVVEARGYG